MPLDTETIHALRDYLKANLSDCDFVVIAVERDAPGDEVQCRILSNVPHAVAANISINAAKQMMAAHATTLRAEGVPN